MERGGRPKQRHHAVRRGERGTHPVLIAVALVIVLIVVVVVFLLIQKPKQVTPVAVLGTSPSASAAAVSTPTPVEVTVAPTEAPTPVPTTPTFLGLEAPSTMSCKNHDGADNIYPPITWSVANATGVTVAIDSIDQKWADYGPSGRTDQTNEPVPFRCDAMPLKHTYFFTTTGGTGPEVTRTITVKGTDG